MSAFVMIRVEVPNMVDTQLNALVNSDAHNGVTQLENLMAAINGGHTPALVDVAIRATTQAISADGSGTTGSYNLK